MAVDIQIPEVGADLAECLDLQDPGRFSLEGFAIPTIAIADLAVARRPPTQRTYCAFMFANAVAAEFAHFRFIVPRGVVARITSLIATSVGAGPMQFAFHVSSGANPAGVAASVTTDGRVAFSSLLPASQWLFESRVAAIVTTHYQRNMAAGVPLELLPPGANWIFGFPPANGDQSVGDRLELVFNVANNFVDLNVCWQEWNWLT